MAYDIDAIIRAYPEAVNVSDTEGAFKADGTKITLDQSLVDAARVELNKLHYQSYDSLSPFRNNGEKKCTFSRQLV